MQINKTIILFPALSRIPSPNSASFLPHTPYRRIFALTPPPFPMYFFRLLSTAFNIIII
jgi:hypothetical protein